MRLSASWSPEPDILFVRSDRAHLVTHLRLEGPADLAIEIVSPHHADIDYEKKRPQYLEHGVGEVWIVDRDARKVFVDQKEEGGYATRPVSAGRIESSAVPGFWIGAEWLWQNPLPPLVTCLRAILPEVNQWAPGRVGPVS